MPPARTRNRLPVALALAICTIVMEANVAGANELIPLGELGINVKFERPHARIHPLGPLDLRLTCTNPVAFSSRFRTSAYGEVWIKVPPGKCLLESASPFLVGSKPYSWRGYVEIFSGKRMSYTLSSKNALLQKGDDSYSMPDPPPSSKTDLPGEGDDSPAPTALAVPVSPTASGDVEPIGTQVYDVLPELFFGIEPVYPARASRAGIQGKVILQAVIDTDGNVNDVTVLSSSNALFNDPAIEAVKQRRYQPARRGGRPVPIYFTIRVDFRLR